MKKKGLCVFIILFVANVFLFSQELILKVKNPINILGWIYQKGMLEDSYYLCDNNYIILASTTNQQKQIIHIYKEHSSPVISSSSYISNMQFVALDDENIVLETSFDDLENPKTRKVHERLVAKSVSVSPDDAMEVVGFANGFVQTHYLLKLAKKAFDVHFKAHNDSVYSIHFNSMGQYFITSGKDEKIKIWDAKTLTLVKELAFCSENQCPAIFSPFNDNFAYCTSRQTLCVSDVGGRSKKEIVVTAGIKIAKFTEKKDRIAVLTEAKSLEFYNITTGQYEGCIPLLKDVEISSFDINIVTGNVLIGTEAGEIYLSSNKEIKNIVLKDKKPKAQARKVQVEQKPIAREEKTKEQPLSTNVLNYLVLEDEEVVKEPELKKPFFPIKNETPLEEPITFDKKVEPAKKASTKIKTLNELVLDDEEVEFQENTSEEMQAKEEEPVEEVEEDALPEEAEEDTAVEEDSSSEKEN
ncbi:MAG: hypothetical protein ACTTKH_00345 [Treponema sp.]